MTTNIGILTVSDRAFRGEYEGKGCPAIHEYFSEILTNEWKAVAVVVPDEIPTIESVIIDMIDNQGCSLVVTPKATENV